jgi:hypothetical protein
MKRDEGMKVIIFKKQIRKNNIGLFSLFCILLIILLRIIPIYSESYLSTASQVDPIGEYLIDGYGYSFTGEGMFNLAGLHVYSIGDINNDSYDDFIIGASQYGSSPVVWGFGKAYLFLGRPTLQWTDPLLPEVDTSFIGEGTSDTLGRWIADLGDVNGDGFDDFAISAVGYGNWKGKTYVFFGGSATSWDVETSVTQANASFIGEAVDDHSGHGIYGVGDVNNDGYNDLLISGEWNDEGGPDAGQVYLIFGRPTHRWTKDTQLPTAVNASFIGNSTIQWLGFDAGSIGGINNDGYDDFAIGAVKNTTATVRHVFIVLGRQTSSWQMDQPISTSNATLSFEEWSGPSNDWISCVEDVNADGFDDFLIGAYMDDTGGTDAGRSFLYFGRPSIQPHSFYQANVSFTGEIPDNWAGLSVAGAGDVNNDGYPDFLIGGVNLFDEQNEGRVYLFFGRSNSKWQPTLTLSDANHTFTGENPGDSFGAHVAGVGDVNNDGFSDIAIGAVHYPVDSIIPGRAYLLLGNSSLSPPPPPPPTTTTSTTTTTTTTTTVPSTSSTSTTTTTSTPSWNIGLVLIILVLYIPIRSKKTR